MSHLETFAIFPALPRCVVCRDGCVAAAASWSQQHQFSPAWVKSHQRDTAHQTPTVTTPAPSSNRHQGPGGAQSPCSPAPGPVYSSVIVIITGHCPMSHVPCPMPGPGLTPQFKCSAAAAQLSYFPRGRALLGWARAALQPSSQTGSGDRRRATAASPEHHGGSGADSAQPGYQQPFLPPDMAPCGYNCI